jgi:hypothetical protein
MLAPAWDRRRMRIGMLSVATHATALLIYQTNVYRLSDDKH